MNFFFRIILVLSLLYFLALNNFWCILFHEWEGFELCYYKGMGLPRPKIIFWGEVFCCCYLIVKSLFSKKIYDSYLFKFIYTLLAIKNFSDNYYQIIDFNFNSQKEKMATVFLFVFILYWLIDVYKDRQEEEVKIFN